METSFYNNLKIFRTIQLGKIVAVNASTATIQLLIIDIDDLENPIKDSDVKVYQVPVLMWGGSSGSIKYTPEIDDMGILLICDRDITNVKQSQGTAQVASRGIGKLKDSVFLGGLIWSASATGVVVESSISITLKVGSTELIISSSGVSIDGIDFKEHVHSAVQSGTDTSGPVVS